MKSSLIITFVFTINLFSTAAFSQGIKDYVVFAKSIEQEKKLDYAGAIETIQSLNDSNSYQSNLRLGWLFYKVGYRDKSELLYNKSITYYNKAISLMPNAIEPRYGFGLPAYLLVDYTDLIIQDKKILEIDPNNKTINGNLGSIYYHQKDYVNALPHLEKVVNQYPFDYDNNLLLGWTYLKLDSTAKAEKCFNTVLFYNPNDESAYEGVNSITKISPISEKVMEAIIKNNQLTKLGDNIGAINALNEVYDKDSYIFNIMIARLNYLERRYLESEKYFKIAAQLNPISLEPKLGLASVYEALNNSTELRIIYQDILKADNQNTVYHYKLGMLDYYTKKDYQAALTHFEKVVSLYPCNSDALLMIGWANYQLNKTNESREYFGKTLCVSPDNASALQGLTIKPLDQMPKKHTGF